MKELDVFIKTIERNQKNANPRDVQDWNTLVQLLKRIVKELEDD